MLKAMINFRNYRWAARLSGFLAYVLIISFMAGQGFEILKTSASDKAINIVFLLLSISLFAYLAGWVIEILGGILLLLTGILLGFYLSLNQLFSDPVHFFILSVSLMIPGILFMLSWRHKLLRIRKANSR
jgi:predicted phage tail protein